MQPGPKTPHRGRSRAPPPLASEDAPAMPAGTVASCLMLLRAGASSRALAALAVEESVASGMFVATAA
eukprot:scaffold6313_cov113-Isochrysis_galbana.AAC.3